MLAVTMAETNKVARQLQCQAISSYQTYVGRLIFFRLFCKCEALSARNIMKLLRIRIYDCIGTLSHSLQSTQEAQNVFTD